MQSEYNSKKVCEQRPRLFSDMKRQRTGERSGRELVKAVSEVSDHIADVVQLRGGPAQSLLFFQVRKLYDKHLPWIWSPDIYSSFIAAHALLTIIPVSG